MLRQVSTTPPAPVRRHGAVWPVPVFEELDLDPARVRATDSASFARPAPRPSYSVLGHGAYQRAGLEPIRHWREALHDAAPTVLAQFRSSSA
ncbi:MAG: sugar nucleotide-binding protein [Mycobacterium sp.]|uniref:sugar nucleotide-binding protein n=1 Tax=Mycobacterium sp. TaxID=1785 RepID=UPI00389ADC77